MHSGMIGLITKEPNKVDVTRNGGKLLLFLSRESRSIMYASMNNLTKMALVISMRLVNFVEKQQSISEWIRVVQTRGQRSRRICRELSGTTIKVSST